MIAQKSHISTSLLLIVNEDMMADTQSVMKPQVPVKIENQRIIIKMDNIRKIRSLFGVFTAFTFHVVFSFGMAFANDNTVLSDNINYLRMSNESYQFNKMDVGKISTTGAVVEKVYEDKSSGFSATIFRNPDGSVVVSFRGTELSDPRDIATDRNILRYAGNEEVQYRKVRELMDITLKGYTNVSVTGHSLGGSLAQYASLYSGAKAVTFNTAPITTNQNALSYVVKPAGLYQSGTSPFLYSPNNITNISTAGDQMSLFNELLEVVDSGNDPLFAYASFRRSIDPSYSVSGTYFGSTKLYQARARAAAIALVKSVKALNGVSTIPLKQVVIGNRVKLKIYLGHSISELEQYFDTTNKPDPYYKLYDVESPLILGKPLQSVITPKPIALSETYGNEWIEPFTLVNPNLGLINESSVAIGNDNPPAETAAERAARLQREADERARVENERLAAIDSLIATRNTLSIVRLDAEARIQNSQNRLTVLRFNELEKVQNISGIVDAEITRLRSIRSTSALSSADETRFQNLLVYQVTLENEQDRIARDITASEAAVAQYQVARDQTVASLATNGQQLTSKGYILNTYTPPNFDPVGLIDWSTYTYNLPPFIQTEVPSSDIVNVVVSTVSLPVTSGTIRKSGALVSEDGGTIRYAFWGVDKALTQKLDGFNHIYYGVGDGGLEWVYGAATTPEQFALRTGTAVFNGGLSGYYAHGDQNSNTVYRDSVNGNLNLNIDFVTNRLTGGGQVNINNAARTESLSFSLNEAAITETGGLTRSLGFNSNATLLGGASGNGNFSGTLYGSDSSEAAGSFAFNLNGGFAAGLWAAGENYNPDESRYVGRITTQGLSGGIYDAEIYSGDGVGQASDTYTDVPVAQGAGGGQVRLVNKFDAGSYQHTSWGDWVANSKTIPNFSEGGYFVSAETSITPSSVIENKTGTASYSGNIIGDYVSNGTRQDAVGQINLTADFSSDKIQGQMQFGHGGAGTNAGGPISPVANLVDIPIDGNGNFAQSATNQNTGDGLNAFGVSGFFTGPDAEEMGGTAWMSLNDGSYNGVFRAKQ